ncbi:MAG: carboxylating nicotinate-nucleotide diphosphorylase, partial [Thiotrichales bacterium]
MHDLSTFLRDLEPAVRFALAEDLGAGDVTAALIPAAATAVATIVLREPAIVCGRPWFDETFRQLDPAIETEWHVGEGSAQPANTILCSLRGSARKLLSGERTALNFLQTLSGTATLTRRYADALTGYTTRILDTRKTLPGLRLAQKYAVARGGGTNHRLGLYDQVLLKENHIAAAGSITLAVVRARTLYPTLLIEVETENLHEFDEAVATTADIIMLDDFSREDIATAVQRNAGRKKLEISGGVTLDNLREFANLGVDFISSGALTKDL